MYSDTWDRMVLQCSTQRKQREWLPKTSAQMSVCHQCSQTRADQLQVLWPLSSLRKRASSWKQTQSLCIKNVIASDLCTFTPTFCGYLLWMAICLCCFSVLAVILPFTERARKPSSIPTSSATRFIEAGSFSHRQKNWYQSIVVHSSYTGVT